MEGFERTVVSTRIRLARNVSGYAFPHKLSVDQAKKIVSLLELPLKHIDEFTRYDVADMDEAQLLNFKENYLISQALIRKKDVASVFINKETNLSIMVNEEDHLREQFFSKGYYNLMKAYDNLTAVDEAIASCVKFSYDEKLGFLTACPTNLGTGMRASVMLFLPALTKNQQYFHTLKEEMLIKGMTIRGIYGEGSKAEGCMYQVSNEVTLGITEQQILERVSKVVSMTSAAEIALQDDMVEKDYISLQDTCSRAFGVLTNCYKLPYEEFVRLMVSVKLGVSTGVYDVDKMSDLDDLIVGLRPSNLEKFFKGAPTEEDLAIKRADYVRAKLPELIYSK